MKNINKSCLDRITWDMPGTEIEKESFRRIEAEADKKGLIGDEWIVARRLIHTTADFSIADDLIFASDPFSAIRCALEEGAAVYSDSNMIKSGISVAKLKIFNKDYSRDSIHCYIAERDIVEAAKAANTSRALASVEKAKSMLHGSVVLIGNAPLALAGIVRLAIEEGICPAALIGMPVGFVNVVEAKELLMQTDIPFITIRGRRGGSPLAVASLHAVMENRTG